MKKTIKLLLLLLLVSNVCMAENTYTNRLTTRRMTTIKSPVWSFTSADNLIYIENSTNIVIPIGYTNVSVITTVIAEYGFEISWLNSGTNEIQWSTNFYDWNNTNIKWIGDQKVFYYTLPIGSRNFYRLKKD